MSRAKLPAILGSLLLAVAFLAFSGSRSCAAPAPAESEKKADAAFEVYKDKAGEYRWRLRMKNTKVIATSGEGYKEKESCLKAIDSVKHVAVDAPVNELEAAPADGETDAKKSS